MLRSTACVRLCGECGLSRGFGALGIVAWPSMLPRAFVESSPAGEVLPWLAMQGLGFVLCAAGRAARRATDRTLPSSRSVENWSMGVLSVGSCCGRGRARVGKVIRGRQVEECSRKWAPVRATGGSPAQILTAWSVDPERVARIERLIGRYQV